MVILSLCTICGVNGAVQSLSSWICQMVGIRVRVCGGRNELSWNAGLYRMANGAKGETKVRSLII